MRWMCPKFCCNTLLPDGIRCTLALGSEVINACSPNHFNLTQDEVEAKHGR